MEDIDCAFRDRRKEIENDPRYLGASGGVTNSGLLNAIDGVTNSDGRIVIMTTNYIDQLDAALIRPGRVDRRFEFEDASDLQICGVFLKFFPDASDVEAWNFLSAIRSFRNEQDNGISMAELQVNEKIYSQTKNNHLGSSNVDSWRSDGCNTVLLQFGK